MTKPKSKSKSKFKPQLKTRPHPELDQRLAKYLPFEMFWQLAFANCLLVPLEAFKDSSEFLYDDYVIYDYLAKEIVEVVALLPMQGFPLRPPRKALSFLRKVMELTYKLPVKRRFIFYFSQKNYYDLYSDLLPLVELKNPEEQWAWDIYDVTQLTYLEEPILVVAGPEPSILHQLEYLSILHRTFDQEAKEAYDRLRSGPVKPKST